MSQRAIADNVVGDRPLIEWMERAAALARATSPHPNPRVGAMVISADGALLAEGVHLGPGTPHAEDAALADTRSAASGGTLIVTLEPCNHHGLTPPCTDAIISAGIARVVVGREDPDERVSGAGIGRLRAAGVVVDVGVGADTALALDPGYFHHREFGRPRVTLKLAATLDGQTAAGDGSSQWITSQEAREDAHRLRALADAVMVGAGTLRTDDPELTVRTAGYAGSQPRPIVVGGLEPLPASAKLYGRNPLIYSPQRLKNVPEEAELEVLWSPAGVDLGAMMKDLGERGIVDVLVEGGATLARSVLREGLVDRLVIYLGAKLAGGAGRAMFDGEFTTLSAARELEILEIARVGPDIRIEARPREDTD